MIKKIKLLLEDTDVVIIDILHLPANPVVGVWYHLFTAGNYYYWNGSSLVNSGGDRPTKPPVNP